MKWKTERKKVRIIETKPLKINLPDILCKFVFYLILGLIYLNYIRVGFLSQIIANRVVTTYFSSCLSEFMKMRHFAS